MCRKLQDFLAVRMCGSTVWMRYERRDPKASSNSVSSTQVMLGHTAKGVVKTMESIE